MSGNRLRRPASGTFPSGGTAIKRLSVGEPSDDRHPDECPGEEEDSCYDGVVHHTSPISTNGPGLKIRFVPPMPRTTSPTSSHALVLTKNPSKSHAAI
jgi:hypothetical protein